MTVQTRLAVAAVVALLSLAAIFRPATRASAAEVPVLLPNASVAMTALKYDGSYQGECWGFMKRVVREATGSQVGFDYRQGFLEGGAVEVSLEQAQVGDVIQFVDDANTAWWADYPGLHTAIILQKFADRHFNVIDSNSQWDGIVHIRTGYDPVAQARLKGLTFHIYRFPGGAGAPAATIGSVPAAGNALVATPDDCLNLREAAARSAAIIVCLSDGTPVTLLSPDLVTADGREWARVETALGTGWVAAEFLSIPPQPAADEPGSES